MSVALCVASRFASSQTDELLLLHPAAGGGGGGWESVSFPSHVFTSHHEAKQSADVRFILGVGKNPVELCDRGLIPPERLCALMFLLHSKCVWLQIFSQRD